MTLIETVLSLFLLLVGILLIGNLFLTGLRYCSRIEKRALASLIAEKKLAQLRAWARTPRPGGFNYDDWSSINGSQAADADEGAYVVKVTARPHLTLSPSASLEAGRNPADLRQMTTSATEVCVSVWEAGEPGQVTRLWSLIAEPERPFDPLTALVIQPSGGAPGSLAHDQEVAFTVTAQDLTGRELKDVFFNWYVLPRGGNGTIKSQTRDGKSATFIHQISILPPGDLPPGTILYAGGAVDVVARAVYRGRELEARFPLDLLP